MGATGVNYLDLPLSFQLVKVSGFYLSRFRLATIALWKNVLSKDRNSHGCKAVICKIPCIDCKAVKLSFFRILAVHARQFPKKTALHVIQWIYFALSKLFNYTLWACMILTLQGIFSPLQANNSWDCKAVKILPCMLAMFPRTCMAV